MLPSVIGGPDRDGWTQDLIYIKRFVRVQKERASTWQGRTEDVPPRRAMSGGRSGRAKREARVRCTGCLNIVRPGLNPRSERTRGVPDPHRVRASHARPIPHDPIRIDNSAQSPARCYDPGSRNVSTFRRWADVVVERNMVPARPEPVNIRS
jgi:hypothetical protein